MSSRNKVRISCNPYSKEILYSLWDSEQEIWCEMSENSALTRSDYTKATIQNKAQGILEEINSTYNMGDIGIDIVFEGTRDDYLELEHVRESYFGSFDIKCVLGDRYVIPAEDVMKEIDSIFSKIDSAFEQYQDKEVKSLLSKFHDATRKVIPVCVMGLYSSGKSAFLNSIIGAEILPSSTDPTTAKNYRITSGSKHEIAFKFGKGLPDEERDIITLRFSEDDYYPYPNDTSKYPILGTLQKAILDENADSSLQSRMYRAINIINEYDKGSAEQSVSDLVDIIVPFNKSSLPLDRYNFVFFDTPGSDSSSNEKHKKVLEDALSGQTNGLPIFITTPDSMDKDSNSELIKSIDSFASALDLTNTMVVVNRSDAFADSDLKKKCDDDAQLKLKSWKSTRIYFVSAIMGIGCKKVEPKKKSSWIDDTYRQIYKKNVEDFSDPKSDDYRKLYLYNIMPQHRYDAYLHEAQVIEDDTSAQESQRIYYNSGMHCVESEILEFSRRYALYSKCASAKDYLTRAISQIQEEIGVIEDGLKRERDELQRKFDEKTAELSQELEKKAERLYESYSQGYGQTLSQLQADYNGDTDSKWIRDEWKRVKKKYSAKDRISRISDSIKSRYKSRTDDYAQKATLATRAYWSEKTDEFKRTCIQIVTQTPTLSDEQKEFLSQYILKVKPMRIKDVSQSRDGLWGIVPRKLFFIIPIGEKFDVDKGIGDYTKEFRTSLATTSTDAQQANRKNLHDWKEDLISGLNAKMAAFNPDLFAYSSDIASKQSRILELSAQQQYISDRINEIDELMSFRGVSVDE